MMQTMKILMFKCTKHVSSSQILMLIKCHFETRRLMNNKNNQMPFKNFQKFLTETMVVTFPLFFSSYSTLLKLIHLCEYVFASCFQDGRHKTSRHQDKSMLFCDLKLRGSVKNTIKKAK